jgi:hypothetical protein
MAHISKFRRVFQVIEGKTPYTHTFARVDKGTEGTLQEDWELGQ